MDPLFKLGGHELDRKRVVMHEIVSRAGLELQSPPMESVVASYGVFLRAYSALLVQIKALVDGWNGFDDESALILESIREILDEAGRA